MKMTEFTPNYMVAVAEQLSFVSAFLGGISAAMLVTVVVFTAPKKSVNWMISSSATAACSLLVAVVASWRLIIALHPESTISTGKALINILYSAMLIGYGVGFLSLLVSVGLSGWLRSRREGVITSVIALVAVVFFVLATPFGI
jgi:hypothetical protein